MRFGFSQFPQLLLSHFPSWSHQTLQTCVLDARSVWPCPVCTPNCGETQQHVGAGRYVSVCVCGVLFVFVSLCVCVCVSKNRCAFVASCWTAAALLVVSSASIRNLSSFSVSFVIKMFVSEKNKKKNYMAYRYRTEQRISSLEGHS